MIFFILVICLGYNAMMVWGEVKRWSLSSCFVGAPALTSRNFKEADFVKVVEYLDRGVKIALEAQSATGKKENTCNCVVRAV